MKPYEPQPDGSYIVHAGLMIDADGAPKAYAPEGSGLPALDYLANAGRAGDWWGLACDEHGHPYIQGQNAPAHDSTSNGYYVSTTSLTHKGYAQNDPMHYINAETEPFVVVPSMFRKAVKGIVLGCLCKVTYKDKTVEAVVADIGPDFGEGSIALARALGIPGSPKIGGVESGVIYQIFPGVAVPGYHLQTA